MLRNLNHPGISRVVLFCESDAPPVPQGEVVASDERITTADAEQHQSTQRQGGKLIDLEKTKLLHRLRGIAAEHIRRGRRGATRHRVARAAGDVRPGLNTSGCGGCP